MTTGPNHTASYQNNRAGKNRQKNFEWSFNYVSRGLLQLYTWEHLVLEGGGGRGKNMSFSQAKQLFFKALSPRGF